MDAVLLQLGREKVFRLDDSWRIVRTKTLKGHRERIMIYPVGHRAQLENEQQVGEAYLLLYQIGSRIFNYAREWTIMEPTFATVPFHWHRVASDLVPEAEDLEQIQRTPRLVIDNKLLTVEKARVFGQDGDVSPR